MINQMVSTTLAGIFLPFVSKHGYSSMFFLFASFTVVYFLVAVFFLPETRGKTLEEIEAHFEGRGRAKRLSGNSVAAHEQGTLREVPGIPFKLREKAPLKKSCLLRPF